jgi:hypothetical protein
VTTLGIIMPSYLRILSYSRGVKPQRSSLFFFCKRGNKLRKFPDTKLEDFELLVSGHLFTRFISHRTNSFDFSIGNLFTRFLSHRTNSFEFSIGQSLHKISIRLSRFTRFLSLIGTLSFWDFSFSRHQNFLDVPSEIPSLKLIGAAVLA